MDGMEWPKLSKIDLSGIAKDWIIEQAADLLQTRGYRNFVCSVG